MERNEVSIQEVQIYLFLKRRGSAWTTSKEIAEETGASGRTCRAHLLKFVKLNIADVAEVFPGHRYRLPEKAAKRNAAYVTRLENAAEVFGLI